MKPIIIAECGNNHEGNIELALKLLRQAFACGVNIVKFQAGTAEGFAKDNKDYHKYQKYELSKNEYDRLVNLAITLNIPIMFSVFPIDSWRWTEYKQFKYFKIPARQCTKENIRLYANQNTFISIPHNILNPEELEIRYGIPLHCVSEYPAEEPMLERINYLKEKLNMEVGYSDHTIGIDVCKKAIDLGAIAIEKHFTLNHNQSDFRDHKLSANPSEMIRLVKYASIKGA